MSRTVLTALATVVLAFGAAGALAARLAAPAAGAAATTEVISVARDLRPIPALAEHVPLPPLAAARSPRAERPRPAHRDAPRRARARGNGPPDREEPPAVATPRETPAVPSRPRATPRRRPGAPVEPAEPAPVSTPVPTAAPVAPVEAPEEEVDPEAEEAPEEAAE